MKESFYLSPFGRGQHQLKTITISRNNTNNTTAANTNDGNSIIIGRNAHSVYCSGQENINVISRKHVEVRLNGEQVQMRLLHQRQGITYLNDKPIVTFEWHDMNLGDTITLIGSEKCFNYVLESTDAVTNNTNDIIADNDNETQINSLNNDDNNVTITNSSTTVLNRSVSDNDVIKNKLERHYECSICLSPMAHAHSVNPCGDSFCYLCITDWATKHTKCPLCQQESDFKLLLPNRLIDNMIREVVSIDPEALQEWEERVKFALDSKKKVTSGTSKASNNSTSSSVINLSYPFTNTTTAITTATTATTATTTAAARNINPMGFRNLIPIALPSSSSSSNQVNIDLTGEVPHLNAHDNNKRKRNEADVLIDLTEDDPVFTPSLHVAMDQATKHGKTCVVCASKISKSIRVDVKVTEIKTDYCHLACLRILRRLPTYQLQFQDPNLYDKITGKDKLQTPQLILLRQSLI